MIMLLFISNFKNNLIVLSFFSLCILVMAYSGIIFIANPKIDIAHAPNPYLENTIIAEEYIFEKKDAPVVIAGSSISKTMLNEIIIDDINYWNLSFTASTPLQSLNLISRSNSNPEIILIEIGWGILNIADNKKEIDTLTDPRLNTMKRFLPAFRKKYQPVNIINSYANRYIFKYRGIDKSQVKEIKPEPKAYKVGLNGYLRLSENRPYDQIDSVLREMRRIIVDLEKRNIRVLFFETPMDKHLAEADAILRIKQKALFYFPAGKYTWISPPSEPGYVTTDGVHLTFASACKFYDYLRRETERLAQSKI